MRNLFIFVYLRVVMKGILKFRFLNKLESHRNQKSILFVDHFYNQDFMALKLAESPFQILRLEAQSTLGPLRRVFSSSVRDLWSPYETEDQFVLSEVRMLMIWFLQRLLVKIDLASIIVPHDNYFWVRELLYVCQKNSILTIVLDKEGMISPYHFETESKRSKEFAPFICDAVFVWSDRQKEYWKKNGDSPAKIFVTGMARSDLLSLKENIRELTYVAVITVFSYELTAYIPHDLVRDGVSWKAQRDDLHSASRQFAEANPQLKLIIKCHPQQEDLLEIEKYFSSNKNVEVVGGSSSAMQLIKRSQLIVCFQSTVLVEAMAASKPIIYHGLSDLEISLSGQLLPFDGIDGVTYATSHRELLKALNYHLENPNPVSYKSDVVSRYIYKPDGNTSARVIDLVVSLCN